MDRPGAWAPPRRDAFATFRGPFTHEGRLLVTAMPMVAAAEIANAAAVVDAATPLARLIGDWAVLVVPSGSRLRTFEDFAAELRRDPAGLTVGGRPEGGSDHVLYGMIGKCLGVDARLLEYAGYLAPEDAAEALQVGRVAALLGSARALRPEIAAGHLRALVVSSGNRIDGIDAPTLLEVDVRLEYSDWCGLLGPREHEPGGQGRGTRPVWQASTPRRAGVPCARPTGGAGSTSAATTSASGSSPRRPAPAGCSTNSGC